MIRYDILAILLANYNEPIEIEYIKNYFKISEKEIKEHINTLKKEHYKIKIDEKTQTITYKLTRSINVQKLIGGNFARRIFFLPAISTTNKMIKIMAEEGAEHGTIIIADKQLESQTIPGQEYISPEGGVWASMILKPEFPPEDLNVFNLGAKIAITRTLSQELNLETQVKWPNEIYFHNKRIGRLFSEAQMTGDHIDYMIISIGVYTNINTKEIGSDKKTKNKIKDTFTSFKDELLQPLNEIKAYWAYLPIAEKIYHEFEDGDYVEFLNEWRNRNMDLCKHIKIDTYTEQGTIEGEVIGITPNALLIIETQEGVYEKIKSPACVVHQR